MLVVSLGVLRRGGLAQMVERSLSMYRDRYPDSPVFIMILHII